MPPTVEVPKRSSVQAPAQRRPARAGWPLERVLFALAGTVSLVSAVLTLVVSKWFGLLAAFVGVNQWLYVLTGSCPASLILRRSCRLSSVIYDNEGPATAQVREVTL